MGPKLPFSFELVRDPPARLVEVRVSGYLDAQATRQYLPELARAIENETGAAPGRPVALVFHDQLSGFESLVVPREHGQFFRDQSATVDLVAVVTSKATVTFGLAVAKLIASPKQTIKAFSDVGAARKWLQEIRDKEREKERAKAVKR